MAEVLVGPAKAGAHAAALKALTEAGFGLGPLGQDPAPEALAVVQAQTGLTTPDACVLASAERLGAGLATFDARLARAARARGVALHGLTIDAP
ncbi:PIN domain-containing protein [Cellulomonas bogoriensis]|uniref:PIN domain-containing protein n=1 Tax=Cellulomonas bogoriensis TaxID=301388 RepID=UPI0018DBAF1E